ncbi:hypothetical protein JOM56_014243 [Amanita muscaria]
MEQPSQDQSSTSLPEGYVCVTSNDGQQYIVPNYLVPATHQAFEAYRKKVEMEVQNAPGGVCLFPACTDAMLSHNMIDIPYVKMDGGALLVPTDPPLTDRECLSLHAKVKAMQERLGISYKDATHWLYMAEVEKLKADQNAHKAFVNLKSCTHDTLIKFNNHLSAIDNRETSGVLLHTFVFYYALDIHKMPIPESPSLAYADAGAGADADQWCEAFSPSLAYADAGADADVKAPDNVH